MTPFRFLLALPIALAGMPARGQDQSTVRPDWSHIQCPSGIECAPTLNTTTTIITPIPLGTITTTYWVSFVCPEKYVRVANDMGQPKCAPEGSLIDGAFK